LLKIKEQDIVNLILDWFLAYRYEVWQNKSMGTYDVKKKIYRKARSTNKLGVSDILGYLRDARIIAVEVKTPEAYKYLLKNYETLKTYFGPSKQKNHLREQIEFIEGVKNAGGFAMFACYLKQVIDGLFSFLNASKLS
jgi:hypothetical protein